MPLNNKRLSHREASGSGKIFVEKKPLPPDMDTLGMRLAKQIVHQKKNVIGAFTCAELGAMHLDEKVQLTAPRKQRCWAG